ncbi:YadA-like family protein [Acinetobacter baumannii]
MQVSVGSVGAERQIKNVGSGEISATSTDAINGSQLYATNAVLGNLTNSIETTLGGNATLNPDGSITMTDIGGTSQNTIHDAILASQEEVAAGTNVSSVTSATGANGQTIYTVNANGTTASAGSSAVTVTAGTPDANNVTDYAVDLSQTTKDSLVKADTALQSVVTQIDGVAVKTVTKDDNTANFVTGTNMKLEDDGLGGIRVSTADDVTFTNVNTTNLTSTGTTQLGDSFTVNSGGSYYTGPITDGDHITNKTYVDQATAAAKTEVAAGTNVSSVTSATGANGQTIYTVNANGTTASAGSSAVTVTAGTPDANNVTDYAVDLSQTTKDSLVKADTALQSVVTQIDGVAVKTVTKDDNTANFVTGTNMKLEDDGLGGIRVSTADDVTFTNVNTTNLTSTGTTQLGDSFTVNSGGSYYTGPITDGDHITNKTYVDQATAAAKTEVAAGTNVSSVTSATGANGQTIYTVNANGTTASAGSSAVTVTAGTPDANNVTDYAVDLSQTTKDSLVKADTALQSVVTQIDGVAVKTVTKDDNTANFVTGTNMKLEDDGLGGIRVSTADDVTFTNVNTTNLTSTGTTQLGDSFTVNSGGSYYTGPITDGDHITNKTYVDQATAAAKTEVAAGTNVSSVTSATGANGQTIYTVNANGTTASAGSSAVTVTAGTPDANNVTDYAVDLSQTTKDSLVKADTALQSVVTQIDGVAVKTVTKDDNTANFVTGTNMKLEDDGLGGIRVSTADDVTFTNVNTTNLTSTGTTQLGDSFTVNSGGSYYTGPITDGDHITNKTYVDQATAAAKTEVAAGTNVSSVTSATGANGQTIYTVNANGTTASAGSSAVTVTAGTPDANNVTDYAVDLSQTTKDSLVKADTALQSVVTQIDGVAVKTVTKDDNTANFVTGTNMKLEDDGLGGIRVSTADDVTFTNVNTTNLTSTGTTQLGDSFTVNSGGSYYTGPITDGDHITNKTYVDQATAAAKTEVAAGTNVSSVTSATGANGQTIYTVNANGTTASAGSSAVTVTAGTPDANNVTDYAVDLSQTTKDSLVKADTALQSVVTQIDGVAVKTVTKDDNTANFVTGTNMKLEDDGLGGIRVSTADDVTFTNVNTTNLTSTGTTQLGDSFTVNSGGSYYTGPITDGDHITNKTYVDQATAAAKTEVAAGTNVSSVTSATGANGQTIYTVNANGTTASAGSSAVTVTAGTPDANNVTDYAVDLSQTTKDSLVKADTALQSVVTQIDGVAVKTVTKDDNTANFVTGTNMKLEDDGLGGIRVSTADDVTFTNVNTTNLTSTGTTQLGDSFTVNSGGSYYTGPITDGDHITNKTYVDQATAAAKTEVAAGTNVSSVTSATGANGQTIYTVNANGTTASAGSSAVTVTAGTPDANNVTDYAVDLSQTTKDSLVKADTALQSVVTQIDGVAVKTVTKDDNTANFVTGTNMKLEDDGLGGIRVSTADDVTFTNVNTTNLTSTGTTQLGDSFTVNSGGSYYTGPITDGDHITNKTYVDQATAAVKTEVEEGKNIKVTSTTGADGQTVYTVATADEVDFDKVTVGDTTISTDGVVITNGPSITKDGISAGGKKVTDVADGLISADSKDAINGSQLHAIGNNVTQLFGGNATYVNNQITWNNIGGTGQNTVDDAIKHVNNQVINANQGWNVSTDSGSTATSTVKPGQTVNINGNSDNGVLVTNSGNDIKVSLSDQIKIGSDDNAVSIDGNAGTIQAGNVSIDGSKGNISAGKVNVNGEAGTVNGLTNTTWNPSNIVSGQAATEDQLQQVAQNANAAATAAKTTVTAGENITVLSSKNSDGSTNYQVATSKDVKFDTVTSGSVTTDKISVGNVTIDQSGINAGGSKVTNIANGTISSTSKDAINGSQLHASNTNIYNYLGGGANYETNTGPTYNVGGGSYNNVGDALNSLDQKVTNVSNQLEEAFYTTNKRIDDVEDRANAGNAQALATAGLPQAYIPGKSMMAISGGTYRGETGYAIGMSSISDNGKWVFKVSGSGNSRGDFGGTVGAGIQW